MVRSSATRRGSGSASASTHADSVSIPNRTRRQFASVPGCGSPSWWAHLVGALTFTRMNIGPTILRNQIEDLMTVKGFGEKTFLKLKPMLTMSEGAN